MAEQFGLSFAQGVDLAQDQRATVLGGKGAGLARMVALGLPVPPGFTFTTGACRTFLDKGWTNGMEAALTACLTDLETTTGKRLGDPQAPLLVSVRSGAPVSMPGMMDTVLNAGMTVGTAQGLGRATGDDRFGWDTLRRFVQSYVSVVLGAPSDLVREVSERHLGNNDGATLDPAALKKATIALREDFTARGFDVPTDPLEQVRQAVGAVFKSWTCERAQTYRGLENIADDLFTAATVQMMAFGNLGDRSGTGVAFSRCPSDGAPGLMGDFLQGAQGEDVVAGTHQTLPMSRLAELWPDVTAKLEETARLLERDLCDLADIEFTVENGKFWMLQYRKGKCSPRAALRIAIDMAEDPDFPLSREEALARVAAILDNPPMLAAPSDTPVGSQDDHLIARGLAASPGQAVGALCTSVDEAVAAEREGRAVILVRRETSPADIAGMAASVGILTTRGGHVSHAAVVARSWGLPAVVGADGIEVRPDGIMASDQWIPTGTEITVDGSSGEVLLGAHHRDEIEAPEVAILKAWRRDQAGSATGTSPSVGYAEPATADSVMRVLALKGMGDSAAIAAVLGADLAKVEAHIADLVEAGAVIAMPRNRYRPAPETADKVDACYRDRAAQIKDRIEPQMGAFHAVNDTFKGIVTDWQMRDVDGTQVINDHSDAAYDAAVTKRIATDVHRVITPILAEVSKVENRLMRYQTRFEQALAGIEAGDKDMVAHPLKDSYHTVWFELHEELIRLSGRVRTE